MLNRFSRSFLGLTRFVVVGLVSVFVVIWLLVVSFKVSPSDVEKAIGESFDGELTVELVFSNNGFECSARVFRLDGNLSANHVAIQAASQPSSLSIEGQKISWIDVGHLPEWNADIANVILPSKQCFSDYPDENQMFRQAIFEARNVKVFSNRNFSEALIWDPDQQLVFQIVKGY